MRLPINMKYAVACMFSLVFAVDAHAATSRIQAKSAVAFTSNTVSFSWDSNTTTGATIACSVWWSDNTSTISTVVDSAAGTLSDSGLGVQRLNAAHSEQMFYFENGTGGTTPTVTATFAASATPSTSSISCHEVAGRATSGALDQKQWNTQNFTGTGTDFITSGSVTTTTDGQYLFCATRAQFATGMTAGTNFTADTTGTNQVLTEHLTDDQASAGNIACTFTPGANDGWITGIMTFKAASTGGGASHRRRSN